MALRRFGLVPQQLRDQIPFVKDPSPLQEGSFGQKKVKQEDELVEVLGQFMPESRVFISYSKPTEFDRRWLSSRMEFRIRRLVEEGNVLQARKEISRVPSGTSSLLDQWRLVLAEPRGKRQGRASDSRVKANLDWIQRNSERYKGQWVALREGQLLGSNPSRLTLRSHLKESNELKGAMFFKFED